MLRIPRMSQSQRKHTSFACRADAHRCTAPCGAMILIRRWPSGVQKVKIEISAIILQMTPLKMVSSWILSRKYYPELTPISLWWSPRMLPKLLRYITMKTRNIRKNTYLTACSTATFCWDSSPKTTMEQWAHQWSRAFPLDWICTLHLSVRCQRGWRSASSDRQRFTNRPSNGWCRRARPLTTG